MRPLVIGLALGLSALGFTPGTAAAATVHRVVAEDSVYVRNKASGFVIGTVFPGERVDIQEQRPDGWGYGSVSGSFPAWYGRRCGWVLLFDRRPGRRPQRLLRSTGQRVPDGCPRTSAYLADDRILDRSSVFLDFGRGGTFIAYVRPCLDPRAFGNYSPDSDEYSSPYPLQMPLFRGLSGEGFGQRYRTARGGAVMVKDAANPVGAPAWFFMRPDCVGVPPVYIGRQGPLDAPNTGPSGTPLERPRTLNATPGQGVVAARWRFWGADQTMGRGVAEVNTCTPTCANGKVARAAGATITLSSRQLSSCGGLPAVFYTKVEYDWPRSLRRRLPYLRATRRQLQPSCAPY